MRIDDWQTSEHGDTREVSAEVDGFRLWFRVPRAYATTTSADPFLAAALLPAMRQGEEIVVAPPLTVSPGLLEGLAFLQEVFYCWNPRELRKVPIRATLRASQPANAGAMCFFSGGVDSMYTFLKRREEITHAVNIHGFDFFLETEAASTLSVADIKDLSQLAWKISQGRTPLSAYLKEAMPPETLAILSRYVETGAEPGRTEQALAAGLADVVARGPLHDGRRFAGVTLRAETRSLLAADPRGAEEVARLNRMLLEDAYPLELLGKDSGVYETAVARYRRFVEGQGKCLIIVETNFYPFGYRYNLGRNLSQGGCLSAVALLLGFPRAFIPSSHSYRHLHPLGSHPLTDPYWSSDSVSIIHDGCEAERKDKLRAICQSPSALADLRVCFDDVNVNCGKCGKCLRTMIDLRLLGAAPGPFPPLTSARPVRKMLVLTDGELVFLRGHMALAAEADDLALRRALSVCNSRNALLRLAIATDKELFGGMAKRAFRRLRPDYGIRRINATPIA